MASVSRTMLVALLLMTANHAAAQARDPAGAELLFSAGREAFENGNYRAACAKFEESQRLDPAPGTLMNLGACNEKLGRLAVAWEHWREALRLLGKDDERYSRLEARLRALELRVPRLELNLATTAPGDTKVTRDGVLLGGPALGVAIPVNPGEHVIEAVAPGRAARRYVLHMGEMKSVVLVVEPGAILPVPKPSQAATAQQQLMVDSAPDNELASRRTLGFIVGGVGIAGLGVAGVTGFLALQKKGDVSDKCEKQGAEYLCADDGMAAASAGKTFATVSTVSAIVGAGALLVGGYFVLSSGESKAHATLLRSQVQATAAHFEVLRTF